MKLALETLFFLICFSSVARNAEGGECEELSVDEAKANKDASEGHRLILRERAKQYECNPGYDSYAFIADLQICKQTEVEVTYQYKWETEEFNCKNFSDVEDTYFGKLEHVDCSTSYVVGIDGSTFFNIPFCKRGH